MDSPHTVLPAVGHVDKTVLIFVLLVDHRHARAAGVQTQRLIGKPHVASVATVVSTTVTLLIRNVSDLPAGLKLRHQRLQRQKAITH